MEMPNGWTVRKERFLWALVNPEGKSVSYSGDEETCRSSVWLQPEFHTGPVYYHKPDKAVEL